MHRSRILELIPLDPEIERTFHKRNKGNKKHTLVEPPSTPMAEEAERAVGEFGPPVATPSAIQRPAIAANNFEIKPAMITMLQNSSVFYGLPNEDPNIHLAIFLEICDTSKFNGVTDDAIRLRLFPFSLKDKAKLWLLSQPKDSIRTWDDLSKKFLAKFFPPAKTAKFRQDIMSFAQYDKEPLYEAWERFKDLLRKCPHHELPTWIQVQTFYNGLSQTSRTLVDAAAGGALMAKTATEAFELLETMASNNYQWPNERLNLKPAGVLEVDAMALLTAQISNLTKKVDSLSVNAVNTNTNFGCDFCAGPHPSSECTTGNPFASVEQVNQIFRFFRGSGCYTYSNMYNPGWRNHPNFSWSNTQNVQRPPPGFLAQEKKINLEDALSQLTMSTTQFMTETKTQFQNQSASIRNLEMQVGQLANVLSGRNQGVLPSQPEINPKNQEQVMAITIREKKQVNIVVDLEKEKLEKEKEAEKSQEEENYAVMPIPSPQLKPYVPQIPFPQRLRKHKIDEQSSNFLETFKKVQINIPFAAALEQMPSYEKFMKDILSKNRKFGDHEKIQLIEECSAILQRKLPPKKKDRGSFKIPCTIGNNFFERALCDLGSSINLLPLSVAKKIGIGEIKPTTVSLQMADRSITYPDGIIEDVLVKVDTLIFPVDFLVLDMEEDSDTQLILGRPFLITSRTLIDVEEGLLTLRVGNEKATFKVFEAIKFPREAEDYTFKKQNLSHPLVHASISKVDKPRVPGSTLYLDELKPYDPGRNELEELQNKSYESARLFKDHTKKGHDKYIKNDWDGTTFKVKGHRLKPHVAAAFLKDVTNIFLNNPK
ncbi:unnamed protein product [Prunus brigantina]